MRSQSEPRTLRESLEAFHAWTKSKGRKLSIEDLDGKFMELAERFLYGGYLKIGNVRIYLTTVEFYFHCEEGSDLKIEDPIVYHQNKKAPEPEKRYPYFPLMALHAHESGYDITFENEAMQYRASVLIREFAIYDEKLGKFLFLKRGSIFNGCVTELKPTLANRYNELELQDGKDYWHDEDDEAEVVIDPIKRKGVYKYGADGVKLSPKVLDERCWGFRRNNVPKLAEP